MLENTTIEAFFVPLLQMVLAHLHVKMKTKTKNQLFKNCLCGINAHKVMRHLFCTSSFQDIGEGATKSVARALCICVFSTCICTQY